MTKKERDAEIARLFRVYQSPYAAQLILALGDIQKDWPADYACWKDFVADLVDAVDCDDMGCFDELFAAQDDH